METEIVFIPQKNKMISSMTITLIDSREKILGREKEKVDIHIDSRIISRYHASIIYQMNKLFIRDIGSSGGTFINGKRLSFQGQKSNFKEIQDNDLIVFGETCDNIYRVDFRLYLSKTFNGDFLSPKRVEEMDLEYFNMCRILDDCSNFVAILERNAIKNKLANFDVERIKYLQSKYTLDPYIHDKDMSWFSNIDELLADYPDVQRSVAEMFKSKIEEDSSQALVKMPRYSESSIFGDTHDTGALSRATNLQLDDMF